SPASAKSSSGGGITTGASCPCACRVINGSPSNGMAARPSRIFRRLLSTEVRMAARMENLTWSSFLFIYDDYAREVTSDHRRHSEMISRQRSQTGRSQDHNFRENCANPLKRVARETG